MIKTRSLVQSLNLTARFLPKYLFRSAVSMSEHSDLLSSQLDSYQRESTNEVISCIKEIDSENYEIVLNDSILYPEGGGQPWDLGHVNGIKVVKVLKSTGQNKQVRVTLTAPLEVGAHVTCVVDWKRRYDFMQQHTAQHLFSAIADKLFSADTVGWSLGDESVSVDLSLALSAVQLSQVESECNEFIRKGLAVSWKVFSRSDLDCADEAQLSLLRGGVKGAALELQELRMVGIEGLDLNPCGGTHLRSLSEINLLKVLGAEKAKGGVRVRFVAGDRALTHFGECVKREAMLSQKLSVPPAQYSEHLDRLFREKRDLLKKFDLYAEELAGHFGAALGSAALSSGALFVAQHRTGADLKFLMKAADSVLAAHPSAVVYLSGDELLPSTAQGKKGKTEPIAGPYVLFGSPEAVGKVKDAVHAAVAGRGGGRPGRLQGQGASLENLSEVARLLETSLLE